VTLPVLVSIAFMYFHFNTQAVNLSECVAEVSSLRNEMKDRVPVSFTPFELRRTPTIYEKTWRKIQRRWSQFTEKRQQELSAMFHRELFADKRRFVHVSDRHPRFADNGFITDEMQSDIKMYLENDDHVLWLKSQGLKGPPIYRGLPMFKTAYDHAVYPMLIAEVRPRTIIEVGTGYGASALWMADQMHLQNIVGHVHTYDINPPTNVSHPRVTFHAGDANNVSSTWPTDVLVNFPHPWVLVCDHHKNIYGTAIHFLKHMQDGDYIVMEDLMGGRTRIEWVQFLRDHAKECPIDTKYTDFFGVNMMCAYDGIIRITLNEMPQ